MVWLLSWTLKKNQLLVKLLLELYKYKGFFVDQQADDWLVWMEAWRHIEEEANAPRTLKSH